MTTVPIANRGEQMAPTPQHDYLRTHQISGSLLRFRLAGEEAALRDQAAVLSTTERFGKTLVKEGALRITQVMLRKGAALGSHQIASPASIQVLRGRLRLTTTDGELQLEPGDLVALDADVAHAAEAVSDCALLITLAMPHAQAAT
jgi:quercetin dioxygenase-like cupin family protein